jgi:hypothetical protein
MLARCPPLYADDLNRLAPALVVVPTDDPVADHGRRYAERLQAAGTPVRLTEYPETGHAFLSMPGLVPQAKAVGAEIGGVPPRSPHRLTDPGLVDDVHRRLADLGGGVLVARRHQLAHDDLAVHMRRDLGRTEQSADRPRGLPDRWRLGGWTQEVPARTAVAARVV